MSTQLSGASIADQVREGLRGPGQKRLPSSLFYDDLGSTLFEAITLLPEYGLTRADERLLRSHSPHIAAAMPEGTIVAELGSGSGKKTRYVLEAVGPRIYCPIDVSRASLEICAAQLSPVVDVRPIQGDYMEGLTAIAHTRRHDESLLLLFLGSTIGNFDAADARDFLAELRRYLRPGDALLIGADLVKPEPIMLAAYDDSTGVTAAFNRNILTRINRELDADFSVRSFRHQARWDAVHHRIEMHLVSDAPQTVNIRGAGLQLRFEAGESIWTESSHKYSIAALDRLASTAGFEVENRWVDPEWPFAECLWRVPTATYR